jgi:hypothetical protein
MQLEIHTDPSPLPTSTTALIEATTKPTIPPTTTSHVSYPKKSRFLDAFTRVFTFSNLNCSPVTQVVLCSSISDQACLIRQLNQPQNITRLTAYKVTTETVVELVTLNFDSSRCKGYEWFITFD